MQLKNNSLKAEHYKTDIPQIMEYTAKEKVIEYYTHSFPYYKYFWYSPDS